MFGRRRQADGGSTRATAGTVAQVRPGPALGLGIVAGIVLAVAVVLAVLQNGDDVRAEWAVFDLDAPLWSLLVAAVLAGALLWAIGGSLVHHARHRGRRAGLRREHPDREGSSTRTVRTFG